LGSPLKPRVIRSGPYKPTLPRTGDDDVSIFRKNGLITRGRDGRFFEQAYRGELNLNENIDLVALTGTLTLIPNVALIDGTGTLFKSELHLGQFILVIDPDVASYLLVVRRIISDIQFEAWVGPDGTTWPNISGLTGYQMAVMFDVNGQRGTALRGNVPKLDKGSFIGVGVGTFRVNNQPLTGESLVLSRKPQIAVYKPLTDTYEVDELGMDTSVPPTLAAVGGGTKMQGGNYSFVITPARKETVGYNNPSDRADVTIATNDKIACTFPAMDTAHGQNAWIVWVTTFTDTLGADLNYLNGPWHRLRLVDDTEVSPAGGTVNFEYYDAEVENNEIVTFNNDPPTDAEFVGVLNNIWVWISCQGQGYNLHPDATSPGPFIVPAKPNNIEAAPLELAFSSSPPETILGAVSAQGRLYLETVAHLQIAQATPSDVVPIVIRPFWRAGFANPYQVVFANGQLFGIPVSGPTKSSADGDESLIEHDWAADVYELTQHWNPGQAMIAVDPQNTMIVLIHAADKLNDAGFWTTRLLGYGLSQGFWIFDWTITSDTQDCIVSGHATIGDRLEFLVGGRKS
jgi:hypothetical protein